MKENQHIQKWMNNKKWYIKKTRPNWMKTTNNKKEQNNNHKIHKTNETLNEDK